MDREDAERLARIETKLDMLLEDRSRLSAVERKQWLHSGGIAVIVLLANKIGIPIHWN